VAVDEEQPIIGNPAAVLHPRATGMPTRNCAVPSHKSKTIQHSYFASGLSWVGQIPLTGCQHAAGNQSARIDYRGTARERGAGNDAATRREVRWVSATVCKKKHVLAAINDNPHKAIVQHRSMEGAFRQRVGRHSHCPVAPCAVRRQRLHALIVAATGQNESKAGTDAPL